MKKVMLLLMFSHSFICAMEKKIARKNYGRCLSSATGKQLWHPGYNFSEDTPYKIHLLCCMSSYRQSGMLDCSSSRSSKIIKDYSGCVAYCEDNLSLYGQDNHKTCLKQCVLVYQDDI